MNKLKSGSNNNGIIKANEAYPVVPRESWINWPHYGVRMSTITIITIEDGGGMT